MYKITLKEMVENEANESIKNYFQDEEKFEYVVHFKLDQVLKNLGITQKDLSLRTGIREATIIGYKKGTIKSISLPILIRIMLELNLKNIDELIEIKLCDDSRIKRITYTYNFSNFEEIYKKLEKSIDDIDEHRRISLNSKLKSLLDVEDFKYTKEITKDEDV